jgi:DEAD/DEAH box helicase domain-containing protein
MFDPVGGFQRIRDLYITYLETAFRIGNEAVSRERRALLETPGELCTAPFLEPLPRYKSVDWGLRELEAQGHLLPQFTPEARRAFIRLVSSGLFDSGDVRLYSHQATMLERGVRSGQPGIVTSGTGSGKTESFLLPVLAQIVREAKTWERPSDGYLQRAWWHDVDGKPFESFTKIPDTRRPLKKNPEADPFVLHRNGEKRPSAMRCLVLYPMNALVEDQLSRLRKALDSEQARAVLDEEFSGNRIFFGRYTSGTPVTGFNIHPRIPARADCQRRARKIKQLFEEMVQFERTQRMVRERGTNEPSGLDEDGQFLFPAVDGAELVSRWDIQQTPPDILITNVSMLGAMLNREVDESIFETTKQWLMSNDDAYFYLVLDELHLQRGAAGTEVAYLLRLLLHRLGLSDPAHRYKVRILASSASLPVAGQEGARSCEYLWDMFGSFGTWTADGQRASGPDDWGRTIVPGEPDPETPLGQDVLAAAPFEEFLRHHEGTKSEPACTSDAQNPPLLDSAWREVAGALGLDASAALSLVVRTAIEESGRRLAAACWSPADGRPRAVAVDEVGQVLFGGASTEAIRGMLLVRGLGDAFPRWFAAEAAITPIAAPSFRLHTFFRSIEGVYAPLDRGASSDVPFRNAQRTIGRLSLERATSTGTSQGATEPNRLPLRLFEVLYCECCGEIFVGGMRRQRGTSQFELLPTEGDLDALPDSASSQRFEELSFDQYCVFWPTVRTEQPAVADTVQTPESWFAASLDPVTGVVRPLSRTRAISDDHSRGWLFAREPRKDKHKRNNQARGTNAPYACPACETDYSPRRVEKSRLSPIRHFRTGFAKTTQLLASDLFHLLKLHSASPKLVSFSDSRQDAAKAALDIESGHHQDVRRDIFINALLAAQAALPKPADSKARLADLTTLFAEAAGSADLDQLQLQRLLTEIEQTKRQGAEAAEGTIRIGDIVEDPRRLSFLGPSVGREPLKPLIRAFVELGIHPVHPAGTRRFYAESNGKLRVFEWNELFVHRNGVCDWRDDLQDQPWLDVARIHLVAEMQKLVTEIILSRTYFSIEEAGLGYLCLPRAAAVGTDTQAFEKAAAFVRVFGDAYRLLDSPYDGTPDPWKDENAIRSSNRVLRFAKAAWGDADAKRNVAQILTQLSNAGHADGLLSTASLRVCLVSPTDDFWRCGKCARVHLHKGAEICTRCLSSLPASASGKVSEIVASNFLSKRLGRAAASAFRLHCEELTGQTENGADRQRKFRGILFPSFRPLLDADRKKVYDENDDEVLVPADPNFLAAREEIDLLAVTTTMEVGIDIGPLQAVLQANMPPQRFNYQQRVGRAGRRRQAFSLVLTVCRTKSHDLYYFREPRKITGDVPPPPFLTKRMPSIARRFLRKWWLNTAFASLRGVASAWPADDMRPPDIHGEFMPTDTYFNDGWRPRLESALNSTSQGARAFVDLLCEDSALPSSEVWPSAPAVVLDELEQLAVRQESRRYGLADSLAEQGNLPMYGMPTRVRDLYVGTSESAHSHQRDWLTIDRDLELAVYEFAPGSVIVKDKMEHVCIGFTGRMPGFLFKPAPGNHVTPMSAPLGEPFWMLECVNCGSWFRYDVSPDDSVGDCISCGRPLEPRRSAESREPLGFRTNFLPSSETDSDGPSGRHRSLQSVAGSLSFTQAGGCNLGIFVGQQIKTYRLNRGGIDPALPGAWLGYSAALGQQKLRRGNREVFLESQMIAENLPNPNDAPRDFTPYVGDSAQRVSRVWLAAPKTTDAIYLVPMVIPSGLSIERLVGPRALNGLTGAQVLDALGRTSVRAAALSATFILMNRAALHLDVDPEEFDVVEPRIFRPAGGAAVPVLQFADRLVNGAGFCDTLGAPDPATGIPLIASLLSSVLKDADQYPLNEFLRGDHETTCEQACYRCLLRYRNQPYHGLLDWRLGLSFLDAFSNASSSCGLDSNFTTPALREWSALVERDVSRLERQFTRTRTRQVGSLRAVLFEGSPKWALVAHPLWDASDPTGVLLEAVTAMGDDPFIIVDSFNFARRPVTIRKAFLDGA